MITLFGRDVSANTRKLLLVLFLLAIGFRLFFVFQTPHYLDQTGSTIRAFNDELSHLKYSHYLWKYRSLPVKEKLFNSEDPMRIDWDWTFYDFEFSQAPLFYVLNIPFAASPQPFIFSRLFCVLLSCFTLLISARCAPMILKQKNLAAVLMMILIGFHPVFVRMGSTITPDNLVWLLSSILFYLYLKDPSFTRKFVFGAVTGLGMLAKVSFVFWPLFLIAKSLFEDSEQRASSFRNALAISGIAFIIAGWWLIRNWIVYSDPTGLVANSGRPGSYLSSGSLYYYSEFISAAVTGSFFPIVEERAGSLMIFKGVIVFVILAFFLQFHTWRSTFRQNKIFRDFLIANVITLLLFLYANLGHSLPEIRNTLAGFLPGASFLIAILISNFGKSSAAICGAVNLIYYWVLL